MSKLLVELKYAPDCMDAIQPYTGDPDAADFFPGGLKEVGTASSGDHDHPGRPGEIGGSGINSIDFRNPSLQKQMVGTINRELAASPYMPKSIAFATDHGEELSDGQNMSESVLAWCSNPSGKLDDATIALQIPTGSAWTDMLAREPVPQSWSKELSGSPLMVATSGMPEVWGIHNTLPQSERVEGVVTHEMGHALWFELYDASYPILHSTDAWSPSDKPASYADIANKFVNVVSTATDRIDGYHGSFDPSSGDDPSKYAMTNVQEYFAESYAAYRYGRTVPKFMSDFFNDIKVQKLVESMREAGVVVVNHLNITGKTYICTMFADKQRVTTP